MITFALCIIYVISAVYVYRNTRDTYKAFLMDDAPLTFGEWILVLLPVVNTITVIYSEYLKIKHRNDKRRRTKG
jgi:hypothetical protein